MTYSLYYGKVIKAKEKTKGGIRMAKKMTSKKPLSGNNRSKALNATKKMQKPNLQVVTIDGKKVRISARELRTIDKKAA